MAQRYSTRVVTRAAGTPALSADANEVEDRVIQLSEDLGGPPSDVQYRTTPAGVMEMVDDLYLPRTWPASVLVPAGSGAAAGNSVHTNLGFSWGAGTPPENATFYGSISLAHGTKISRLTAYGTLVDAAAAVHVKLMRIDLTSGGEVELASVSLTGTAGVGLNGFDDLAAAEEVDNINLSYGIKVNLANNSADLDAIFRGIRLS